MYGVTQRQSPDFDITMRESLSTVGGANVSEHTMGRFLRVVGGARTYEFTTRRYRLWVMFTRS